MLIIVITAVNDKKNNIQVEPVYPHNFHPLIWLSVNSLDPYWARLAQPAHSEGDQSYSLFPFGGLSEALEWHFFCLFRPAES